MNSPVRSEVKHYPCYIAGVPVSDTPLLEVHHPYDRSLVGTASFLNASYLEKALSSTRLSQQPLSRYQRYEILHAARALITKHADELAELICAESGLCMRETRYEVGRSQDVFQFAAIESLKDDGQIFSCDISPQGQSRKIFTLREPLPLAVAITPFNHPLNQVAHKVAPAIAAGVPLILKPSEKTPLSALRLAELLYQAGLPKNMLSVVLGDVKEFVGPLMEDSRVELVSFTGSVAIGKEIARQVGYKKLCLELGGNSPLIVLEDADMELAVTLAAEGCFRNSGQRCTAVKRLLIQETIADEFSAALKEKAATYVCGDPRLASTRVGTVIDEAAAIQLENRIGQAVEMGARILFGGERTGALLQPTVLDHVPRNAEMVVKESFGPLAPIMRVQNLNDAIELANSTAFGLSSGIVTRDMNSALQAVQRIRTGTVNVNQVPGYRIENSPFGGVKDSGLGIKEGVAEAMKFMTNVKTFSLPW